MKPSVKEAQEAQDIQKLERENHTFKERFSQVFSENKVLKEEIENYQENVKKLEWTLLQLQKKQQQ